MFNLDELQTLRFAMTEVPEVGGQLGAYALSPSLMISIVISYAPGVPCQGTFST